MPTRHIVWIDWMKALLILFVVLGHSGSVLSGAIYLFHVPAFFFISGYLCDYSKPNQGTLNHNRYLIFAILIYNIVFIIINALIVSQLGISIMRSKMDCNSQELILHPILGITWCYYKNNPFTIPLCSQFWFVWVLIIMKFAYRFIALKSSRYRLIICLLCILYTTIISHLHIETFFYIDRTICAFPFFILGNMFSTKYIYSANKIPNNTFNQKLINLLLSLALVLLMCSIGYFINQSSVDMFLFELGNSIIVYYLMAVIGTYALILFCQILPQNLIIEQISIGTFLILAMHLILIRQLIQINIIQWDKSRLLELAIILIICIPLIIFSKKYLPILLGKNK